jgi:hypothetical protein
VALTDAGALCQRLDRRETPPVVDVEVQCNPHRNQFSGRGQHLIVDREHRPNPVVAVEKPFDLGRLGLTL